MQDATNYRHYEKECERLAKAMPDESRRTLLEIAAAWRALAAEADRRAVTSPRAAAEDGAAPKRDVVD